jgi:predicted RNA binding protein YcfA (HicA-like mRNA interferase family)
MTSNEMRRWLIKLGAVFTPGRGCHFHVALNGRKTIIPMHHKELGKGLAEQIKKDLGLK